MHEGIENSEIKEFKDGDIVKVFRKSTNEIQDGWRVLGTISTEGKYQVVREREDGKGLEQKFVTAEDLAGWNS